MQYLVSTRTLCGTAQSSPHMGSQEPLAPAALCPPLCSSRPVMETHSECGEDAQEMIIVAAVPLTALCSSRPVAKTHRVW
jgi:hypothetical protein